LVAATAFQQIELSRDPSRSAGQSAGCLPERIRCFFFLCSFHDTEAMRYSLSTGPVSVIKTATIIVLKTS